MRNRDLARAAALAGALLVAVPAVELLLGGKGPAAARAIVGSFGLVFFFLSARLYAGKERS